MHELTRKLRRGLTIIELLVVISIIGLLMAILLPAIMGASASARRTQCANNQRNVGLALLHEAEAKGRFPAAGHWSPTTPDRYHSWVVTILPWLERRDVRRNWDLDLPVTHPQNAAQGATSIAVLTCPADISVESGQGNLSYVVNGGIGYTIPND